ncbi:MAG: tetratricopeptide repeat-containing protein [Magnetococcales bacterium]|nr:tetratricopeptide repeat-containing protein [Magnetococcales bacterium]
MYRLQDRFAEAESLLKRIVAIREKELGSEHRQVAIYLNNLAMLHMDQGRYVLAEPLFKRVLAIREKAVGPENTLVAGTLVRLAELYVRQGRYTDAEPLFERTLAIREKALGTEHPKVFDTLNDWAESYLVQGRHEQALTLLMRGFRIANSFLEQNLWQVGGKTRRSLAKQVDNEDIYLSLLSHLRTEVTAREAFVYSLSRKGLLARMAEEVQALIQAGGDSELQEKAELLDTRKKEQAKLSASGSEQKQPQLELLNREIDTLEAELSRKVWAAGRGKSEVTPEQVLSALQPGQVLVDFLVYRERDLQTLAYKELQIIALVADPQAKPAIRMVKIGAMNPVANRIKAYREAKKEPAANKLQEEELARQLYISLWESLQPLLTGKETVYLVPSGILNSLSFEDLQDAQGKTVGQTSKLVTLATSHEAVLLAQAKERSSGGQ